ncbi:Piso0_002319 [Millerozyma farinosa CBS 7064]|uniref:Piso0_002319 protein n=1 Tax=Pichia sorbitophila (strain ATCC MYA-4447 / BCRC 22081 / CBS 7064 / NBRC 10061 / NRRL Y-12695) TaxID=559304 RepID=G8YEQ7_PICSO|nr:Piso0_002319 [Millerozyma farinosa CBS 7064]
MRWLFKLSGRYGKRCLPRQVIRPVRFNSGLSNDKIIQEYKDKLEKKAKELGLENVDGLKEKFKDEIEAKKKEFMAVDPLKELEKRQSEASQDKTIKVRSPIDKDMSKKPFKTLDSYIAVDKTKELPRKELEFIWRARFSNKENNVHAILDSKQFASMYSNAFKNPNFILPVPRGNEGYEMHFVQWSFAGPQTTHCMITTVVEYKLHKEFAKPHTTLTFHQELMESHDAVLMNGQTDPDANVSMDDAQLLVLNIQRFYGGVGSDDSVMKKVSLLRDFNSGKEDFPIDALIAEATKFD